LSAGEGEAEVVKVADFGFAKNFGEEKLVTSCGSPGYVGTDCSLSS
jgi:serine/threonine protein kinase